MERGILSFPLELLNCDSVGCGKGPIHVYGLS